MLERTLGSQTYAFTQTPNVKASPGCKVQSEGPSGSQVDTESASTGATRFKQRRTFQVFVQDVLKAVEDGFVVRDFPALAGVCPLLPALEVGVDFTRVGGVLLVVGHLQTENRAEFNL